MQTKKISCTVLHFLAELPCRIWTAIYSDLPLANLQILAWCHFFPTVCHKCFNRRIGLSSSVHCVFLFQDSFQFLFGDGGKSLFIIMGIIVCRHLELDTLLSLISMEKLHNQYIMKIFHPLKLKKVSCRMQSNFT